VKQDGRDDSSSELSSLSNGEDEEPTSRKKQRVSKISKTPESRQIAFANIDPDDKIINVAYKDDLKRKGSGSDGGRVPK